MKSLVVARFPTYGRYCLLLAVLVPPIVFHKATLDVFNLVKITSFAVFVILAFSLWLMSAAERGVWLPRVRLLLPVALYLLAAGVSTIFSMSPTVSIFGMTHRYGGLVSLVLYAAAFVAIIGLYWERPEDLRQIPIAAAIATILVTGYALIQAAGLDWNRWVAAIEGSPGSPIGTLGNSNFAGGYLCIGTPLLLYVALSQKKRWRRWVLFALCAAALLALWFTSSRGAMIGLGIGFATILFVLRDHLSRLLKIASIAAASLGFVLAFLVLVHPGMEGPPGPLRRFDVFGTETFEARQFFWSAAWSMFTDRPLTGVGIDAYYAAYPPHRVAADGAQQGMRLADKPHNIFLESAATTGVLGLVAYVSLAGLTIFYGYRRSRDLDWDAKLLCSGLLGGLAAYFGQGFFSIDVPPLASSGWVLMAAIAAIADSGAVRMREAVHALAEQPNNNGRKGRKRNRKKAAAAPGPPERGGRFLWQVHAIVAVVTVLALVAAVRPYRADIKMKEGRGALSKSQVRTEALYKAGTRLNPWDATYWSQRARVAAAQVKRGKPKRHNDFWMRETLARHRRALQIQPGNVFLMATVATHHSTWAVNIDPKHFVEAQRWWKRILAHDPTDYEAHRRYAILLDVWGKKLEDDSLRRSAAREMERAARMNRPGDDFFRNERLDKIWVTAARILLTLEEPTGSERKRAMDMLEAVLKRDPDDKDAKKVLDGVKPPPAQ